MSWIGFRQTLTFTRRNARLKRIAVAVLAIVAGLAVLGLFAGKSAADALARAGDSAQQAARESGRATEATAARVRAEADGAKAAGEATRARGVAEEQQRLAASAVAERQLAQREAERQQVLTAEATANRRLAEAARDAQQLAGRAQHAFDSDQNPLMALAYGVAALERAPTVEAADTVARALEPQPDTRCCGQARLVCDPSEVHGPGPLPAGLEQDRGPRLLAPSPRCSRSRR